MDEIISECGFTGSDEEIARALIGFRKGNSGF